MKSNSKLRIWIAILSGPAGQTIDAELLRCRPRWAIHTPDGAWHVAQCDIADPHSLYIPRKDVWFTITRDRCGVITEVHAAAIEPSFDLTPSPGHTIELRAGGLNGGDSNPIHLTSALTPRPDAAAAHPKGTPP